MSQVKQCKHAQCKWKNSLAETVRYETTKSRTALAEHQRVKDYHPCCTNDTERCATGKKIRSWVELSGKSKYHRNSETLVCCKHPDCGKRFKSLESRSNHHKLVHYCNPRCKLCTKHHPPPTATEEPLPTNLPMRLSIPERLRVIADKIQNPDAVIDINLISVPGNAIVVDDSNGQVTASYFNEQFSGSLSQIVSGIQQAGMSLSTETLAWLLQDRAVLDKLLEAALPQARELLQGNSIVARKLLEKQHEDVANRLSFPSLQALLEMKDILKISDHNWSVVDSTFGLPQNRRITAIRAHRTTTQNKVLSPTPGGRGFQRDLLEAIRDAVRIEKPPISPSGDTACISLKIAWDEGHMTRHRPMEVCTMDIVSDKNVSTCKSWKNSYLIALFGAKPGESSVETSEILKEELADIFEAVNAFQASPKMMINGIEYTIKIFVCLDLACMTKSLGLKDLWRHNSAFRCPWCCVTKQQIGDFSIPEWSFRNINTMHELFDEIAHLAPATRKGKGPRYQGIWEKPSLKLPLKRYIPCMVHLIMSIVKFLRKILFAEIEPYFDAVLKYRAAIHSAIKIPKQNEGNFVPNLTKQKEIIETLEKLKINRSESLKLLEEHELVCECLNLIPDQTAAAGIKLAWKRCWSLICCAANPPEGFTPAVWKTRAQLFASDLTKHIVTEKTTTYLHIFVYHCGYFIGKYHGLEHLSNYATEGTVGEVKKSSMSAAPRHGSNNELATVKVVMERSIRMKPLYWKQAKDLDCSKTWFRNIAAAKDWDDETLWE